MRHLDELLDHLFSDREIGNHAVFHRTNGLDIARNPAEHLFGFLADGLDRFLAIGSPFLPDRDNRRFIEHDAFAAHINERVRSAKINRQIIGKIPAQKTEHSQITFYLLIMAPPDFSLSLGDIEHIADLARLELAASEAEHMHAQLSHFFKFVAQIQAVDTHGIEPLVYPVEEGCTPRLRDDTLTESPERDACQNGAPDIYNGLYRVPQVIE